MMNRNAALAIATATSLMALAAPGHAKDKDVELVTCEESIGTIALVDSPNAGWAQYDLGSPRMLLTQLAAQSGCFTPHTATDGTPARFLVTAIAGTKEEVDQGINMATGVAAEALLRSGAAAGILSSVPFGGAALSMFGGLGGKKKTVAAALTVVSPATGQPLAAGTGSVKKSSISFGGASWASSAANASGYAGSKNGKKLTEAFILAFNQLVEQRAALDAAPQAGAPSAITETGPEAVAAIDTVMRAAPDAASAEVRSLREGTELTPSGKREGLWIEVSDNFGTTGWVTIEDLQ